MQKELPVKLETLRDPTFSADACVAHLMNASGQNIGDLQTSLEALLEKASLTIGEETLRKHTALRTAGKKLEFAHQQVQLLADQVDTARQQTQVGMNDLYGTQMEADNPDSDDDTVLFPFDGILDALSAAAIARSLNTKDCSTLIGSATHLDTLLGSGDFIGVVSAMGKLMMNDQTKSDSYAMASSIVIIYFGRQLAERLENSVTFSTADPHSAQLLIGLQQVLKGDEFIERLELALLARREEASITSLQSLVATQLAVDPSVKNVTLAATKAAVSDVKEVIRFFTNVSESSKKKKVVGVIENPSFVYAWGSQFLCRVASEFILPLLRAASLTLLDMETSIQTMRTAVQCQQLAKKGFKGILGASLLSSKFIKCLDVWRDREVLNPTLERTAMLFKAETFWVNTCMTAITPQQLGHDKPEDILRPSKAAQEPIHPVVHVALSCLRSWCATTRQKDSQIDLPIRLCAAKLVSLTLQRLLSSGEESSSRGKSSGASPEAKHDTETIDVIQLARIANAALLASKGDASFMMSSSKTHLWPSVIEWTRSIVMAPSSRNSSQNRHQPSIFCSYVNAGVDSTSRGLRILEIVRLVRRMVGWVGARAVGAALAAEVLQSSSSVNERTSSASRDQPELTVLLLPLIELKETPFIDVTGNSITSEGLTKTTATSLADLRGNLIPSLKSNASITAVMIRNALVDSLHPDQMSKTITQTH